MTQTLRSALKAEDELTVEDHFCGAGGSTTGALLVDGVRVVHAANHSKLAIATHSANYPDVEHSLADIPSMDPRRAPRAAVLITTPECRARSYARGRPKDDPHLFRPGDGLDEKSRSTMDEVTRFAEANRYQAIVVENVPQLVDWCEPSETGHWPRIVKGKEIKCNCGATFRRWLKDLTNLDYEHRKLFWNSAFFPPTPQSRDRCYVALWLKGQRIPDLDHFPICWCNACQALVDGVQTMKPHLPKPPQVAKAWGPHDTAWGRYGAQYFYACMRCGARAVPAITPAATAIDWSLPAERIADRKEPLADNTMARIQRGLEKIADRPLVVPLDRLTEPYSRVCRDALGNVLPTQTAQQRAGLVVQVGGNLGRLHADGTIDRVAAQKSWPTDQPLRALHGSLDRGLVVPDVGGNPRAPRSTDDTLPTMLTRETTGLVVANRGGKKSTRTPTTDNGPLPALTTINSLYALGLPRLVLSNMKNGIPALDVDEEMSTVTTGNKLYAVDPWIVPLRKHTKAVRAADQAMPTIVAGGNQHYLATPPGMLVANYGGRGGPEHKQGWAKPADAAPLGSVTTRDSHSIVTLRGSGQAHPVADPLLTCATVEQHTLVGGELPNIMDCTFRMLEPSEIGRGMAMHFTASGARYVVHGNRRDQVKQYGNAVTPPPMARILTGIRDSLA